MTAPVPVWMLKPDIVERLRADWTVYDKDTMPWIELCREAADEIDRLRAGLLRWFREDAGIADEMTWPQIDRQNERYNELMALGVDPYAEKF